MQVNTRSSYAARVADMASLQSAIATAAAQISSGKRLSAPSDDPVAAARATQLTRALAANAADRGAIDRATGRLASTDTALDGIGVLMQRAKELALQGANGTLSAGDRTTIANEIGHLGDQLLGLANARDSDGLALFAGARSGSDAYATDVDGTVRWAGAGTSPTLVLATGRVATGLDGPAVFAGLDGGMTTAVPGAPPLPAIPAAPIVTDAFAVLKGLRNALGEADPAARAAATANALTGLDAAIGRTADSRAAVGGGLARLASEVGRLDAQTLALRTDLSATEDTDATQAIAELQRLTTVLQATQLSFVKINSLSLWAELR